MPKITRGRHAPPSENRCRTAMRDRPASTGLLPTLRVPALVVVGAEGQISPPVAMQRLAAAIPCARCVEIPAAGYLAPLEQPLAVGRALTEFLESLG